ncbi:hypothetical protein M758_12G190000 [Ceratodon purpureus]|nr:hypothetical protein M758_12G190000 [Ceratodon purpureus]
MRDCEKHPSESQPGGGVCASCLRERLTWLWRGESFCVDDLENALPSRAAAEDLVLRDEGRVLASQPQGVGSTLSVRKELEANGDVAGGRLLLSKVSSDDVRDRDQSIGGGLSAVVVDSSLGDTLDGGGASNNPTVVTHQNSQSNAKDIVVEWVEFHARRRRSLELDLDSLKAQSRSFDSSEAKPSVDVLMAANHARRGSVERSPQLSILMSAQKLQTRSMPLDNRSAEDTASRVIREEADELYTDDLDFLEGLQERDGGGGITLQDGGREQRCFSPAWQSRKSPKWMRVLISPMTSRNKVFPSRSKEDVRKGRGSRKRLTRFASSDWNHTDANGVASPHWMDALRMKEGLPDGRRRTTIRSSLLSWLQDSERTKMKKYEQSRQLSSSLSSSSMDSGSTNTLLRDLITVGHLHEIAEEIEEEDDVPTPDSLDDIASFGKFLLSAAQRQPQAGLTNLSRAASC